MNLEVSDPDGLPTEFIVRLEEASRDLRDINGVKIFQIVEDNGQFYLETTDPAGLDYEKPLMPEISMNIISLSMWGKNGTASKSLKIPII